MGKKKTDTKYRKLLCLLFLFFIGSGFICGETAFILEDNSPTALLDEESEDFDLIKKDTNEEQDKKIDFEKAFLNQKMQLHKGYLLSAGVSSDVYKAFLNLHSPEPLPDFSLRVKNFGLMLMPLERLHKKYPDKVLPQLTFFVGAASLSGLKTMATKPAFSALKPNFTGIIFPRKESMNFSQLSKKIHYAVEFRITDFSVVFFAENNTQTDSESIIAKALTKKDAAQIHIPKKGFNYYVTADWKAKIGKNKTDKIAVSMFSGFYPEPKFFKVNKKNFAYHPYNTVLAFGTVFVHPIIATQIFAAMNMQVDKKIGGAGRAEVDIFYRYAGINLGTSYLSKDYIGLHNTMQKEKIAFFVQPIFKWNFLEARGMFFSYFTTEKNETKKIAFDYGAAVNINHKIAEQKNLFTFKADTYKLQNSLKIKSIKEWFPSGIRYFDFFFIGLQYEFQQKKINPYSIKKYGIETAIRFNIQKRMSLAASGFFDRSNAVKKQKKADPVHEWNAPKYGGALQWTFDILTTPVKHGITAEIKLQNTQPNFDFLLAYRVALK
ncbi:hypothetical protein [Treponema phagedenis]|uniref:Uncharacterized protein n=2 Tax=Treponema phagedenis TaxID=162 RepID=A0AAE6IVW8_TREPH|nr:hypothetical protein [Treponema phagedenis]NVP24860.1 hypothetical protein [Treponema phagedenis]QEJ96005.1 hypothetical protein FUT79_12880 [Treponema phagedenis]QEJ98966.1 hypothetical protein FUT82_13850 [Treponema phagedenis]QEK04474.1 hypothetical protein FUT83_12150 [Treponema phagedenis]QEK06884.1 hypothetical protein FUT80_09290 [Treponema phagedenis]